MRLDPAAAITNKERWGGYVLLTLESPAIAGLAAPGQFLMIKTAPGSRPLLRRPLSIHGRSGGALDLFFKVEGEGTTLLAGKKPGETLDILGPLGKGFDLSLGLAGRKPAEAPAVAAGGGRGIAPLAFLAAEMRAAGRPLKVLYGGRTAADIPLKDRLEAAGFRLECSTDDGSFGFKGLVTDLLSEEIRHTPPAAVYACGPEPMLEAAARIAAAAGLPAELSLEARMGCGFGACWGCVHRLRKNGEEAWVKVCEEGPVFSGGDVVWKAAS
jgi:dihydroorotate dehydrogenase electron transfer subunit